MPNPDGTLTRHEHATAIMVLARKHHEAGMSLEDAIAAAGREHREEIKRVGEQKIAAVMKRLGEERKLERHK